MPYTSTKVAWPVQARIPLACLVALTILMLANMWVPGNSRSRARTAPAPATNHTVLRQATAMPSFRDLASPSTTKRWGLRMYSPGAAAWSWRVPWRPDTMPYLAPRESNHPRALQPTNFPNVAVASSTLLARSRSNSSFARRRLLSRSLSAGRATSCVASFSLTVNGPPAPCIEVSAIQDDLTARTYLQIKV